jgi:F-type H+-transporting ATPase subunit delta
VIAGEVGSRYARALFNLASSKAELESGRLELEAFVEALKNNPRLRTFLSAPQIKREEKRKVLQAILAGKTDQKFLNFLYFVLEKGRMNFLEEISREYHHRVKESLGVLEASLITAVPAGQELKERLKAKLEKNYQRKIEMKEKVDPQIVGGVILVLANQVMDWSIRDRLLSLKESLLEVRVA